MKECFIVTPIGQDNSAIRREIDGLITGVFAPVLEKFDLKTTAAHHISETGSITRQVVKRLLEADLVIANLTNLNPNVMYELGIRHCSRKPTIVVAREDVTLPFDLSDERTIFYHNDIYGVNELKERLEAVIPSALQDDNPDNPVYRVVDVDLIKIPEGATDSDTILNHRLSQFENQLDDISRYIKTNPTTKSRRLKDMVDTSNRLKFSFYLSDHELDGFLDFCSSHNITTDDKPVYKEQSLVIAYPDTNEQIAWIEKYTLENGLKRI